MNAYAQLQYGRTTDWNKVSLKLPFSAVAQDGRANMAFVQGNSEEIRSACWAT